MIEFALMSFIYVPLLLGMFTVGMGLVKSLQVNSLARDLDNLYIHGTDFSAYNAQLLAQRLGTGLNLQFPSFAGNQATNTGTTGDGILWITQLMYVGPTTGSQCATVGAANCTNHDSFVYTQQIVFGNSSLTTQKDTTIGYPTGATLSTAGVVANYLTDSKAALSAANDTAMDGLWQTTANGQAALADGQIIYIVEAFFQTPALSLGNFTSKGVYARYFF